MATLACYALCSIICCGTRGNILPPTNTLEFTLVRFSKMDVRFTTCATMAPASIKDQRTACFSPSSGFIPQPSSPVTESDWLQYKESCAGTEERFGPRLSWSKVQLSIFGWLLLDPDHRLPMPTLDKPQSRRSALIKEVATTRLIGPLSSPRRATRCKPLAAARDPFETPYRFLPASSPTD